MKRILVLFSWFWMAIGCLSVQAVTQTDSLVADSDSLRKMSLNTIIVNYSPDDFRGLQFGAFFNTLGGESRGWQLGGVVNVAQGVKGLQIAGFSNISGTPLRGLQLSTVSNLSRGVKTGVQLSPLMNISSSHMRGVQMGLYNYADTLNGLQIGFVNVAQSHPKGWQIGVVNYSQDTVARKIGLVNVNPNTQIDLMAYAGSGTKGNIALRFRNRSTYSIIGAGTHYMGLDEKFSGALFYRLGQYFRLSDKWTLSGDVGYYHVETFEHNTDKKPERLFSLQARLNADYQLSSQLGIFASVGYGDTRHYHHWVRYCRRPIVEAGLSFRMNGENSASRSQIDLNERLEKARRGTRPQSFALSDDLAKPRPWLAALEVTGINLLVHAFDRFVMEEEFAQVNLHTIHRNLRTGFVWDNDQFSTNLFAHPYHGNLYYNAARSNHLSFWQSAPYALAGSLMWELFGEVEPPAVNDLMATTMGGICIGEVAHRVSDLILYGGRGRKSSFWRKMGASVVSPMKLVNGGISSRKYFQGQNLPFADISVTFGDRYLADNGALFRGEHNPYVNFYLEYGDALDREGGGKPYDFFDFEATFGLSGNQPIINYLSILGRLWSFSIYTGNRLNAEFGIYQHFNYYDSKPVKDGSDLTPYRISEAAAVGPGLVIEHFGIGSLEKLQQRFLLSGIVLGGTKSDYYNVIDRDYNMGSGFSVKSKTHMEFRNLGRFILKANYFLLYTWKGYDEKDLATIQPLYLNAQGDRGNASLFVLQPLLEIDFSSRWSLVAAASYFIRDTHYRDYDDVRARTFEFRGGLTYHF